MRSQAMLSHRDQLAEVLSDLTERERDRETEAHMETETEICYEEVRARLVH